MCEASLTLFEYLQLEKNEILGSDNMWFTGVTIGHHPTPEEAARHYVENGGPENFQKRFGHLRKLSNS